MIALVEMKFDWNQASSNLQIISVSLVLSHQQVTSQSCTLEVLYIINLLVDC